MAILNLLYPLNQGKLHLSLIIYKGRLFFNPALIQYERKYALMMKCSENFVGIQKMPSYNLKSVFWLLQIDF